MPMRDGTGLRGMGPMTGRGFGPCGRPRGRHFAYGRGLGHGPGYHGRWEGIRRQFYDDTWDRMATKEARKSFIKNEITLLKERQKILEERLESLQEDD